MPNMNPQAIRISNSARSEETSVDKCQATSDKSLQSLLD